MKSHAIVPLLVVSLLSLSIVACGKKETPPAPVTVAPAPTTYVEDQVNGPVTVKAVTLGNAINASKKVTAPLSSFAPTDTLYAVVDTIGSGKANLKADWTFHKGDKTAPVNQTSQDIDASGPASNEFHISKPDGWPAGQYQVEIFLNGSSVDVQKFSVQ